MLTGVMVSAKIVLSRVFICILLMVRNKKTLTITVRVYIFLNTAAARQQSGLSICHHQYLFVVIICVAKLNAFASKKQTVLENCYFFYDRLKKFYHD